jgi:hypothetical protein
MLHRCCSGNVDKFQHYLCDIKSEMNSRNSCQCPQLIFFGMCLECKTKRENINKGKAIPVTDRLCGLVVRSGGPGSIPGTTRKKKVVVLERGPPSLLSTT